MYYKKIVVLSAILILWACWTIMSFRGAYISYTASEDNIISEKGYAYLLRWPYAPSGFEVIKDNSRKPYNPPTLMYENGKVFGGMENFSKVVTEGRGGYTHSGTANLYFSTPDNASPHESQRKYTVKYVVIFSEFTRKILLIFTIVLSLIAAMTILRPPQKSET